MAGGLLALRRRKHTYVRRYWMFAVPAALLVAAVIVFPWLFTLFMSVHDWKVSGNTYYVGLTNYVHLMHDDRFLWAVVRTLYFTTAAVVLPVGIGLWAAVCFARRFPLRGAARTVFILPMMATPVAIALVWTMMFHPQLGVLNYLLTSVGLPPSSWVYSSDTVIPTLVMVETWQWTPLVMLIVLGGISSLPVDPYEAAQIDGASGWQMFRYITVAADLAVHRGRRGDPHHRRAEGVRHDLRDHQRRAGTSSETINMLLYQTAFGYYDLGYASAMVVVFFVLIMVLSLVLLGTRQQELTL